MYIAFRNTWILLKYFQEVELAKIGSFTIDTQQLIKISISVRTFAINLQVLDSNSAWENPQF